jgi:hypothetical protein
LFATASNAGGATTEDSLGRLAEQPALALDNENRLHAFWRGGPKAQIFHSWTFAGDAASPATWTSPAALPMLGRPGSWPDVVVDPDSHTLQVIYAIPYNEGRGIYTVHSTDGGTSWLTPTVVFDAAAAGWDSVDLPRLTLDAQTHTLHAVWLKTSLIGGARGEAAFYARSADGGLSWSEPLTLTATAPEQLRIATAGANNIYIVWTQAVSTENSTVPLSEVWGQSTSDGGQRWTEPQRIPGLEVTGSVSLVADETGGLYLLGMGVSLNGEAVLLYSRWDGQGWSKPETSGLGVNAASGNAAVAVVMPTAQRLGALLREFIQAPGSDGQFKLMSTGREIPNLPPVKPAPTLTPLATATPTVTSVPIPTATAKPVLKADLPRGKNSSLPISLPLALGGALIAVIIVGVIVVRVLRTAIR